MEYLIGSWGVVQCSNALGWPEKGKDQPMTSRSHMARDTRHGAVGSQFHSRVPTTSRRHLCQWPTAQKHPHVPCPMPNRGWSALYSRHRRALIRPVRSPRGAMAQKSPHAVLLGHLSCALSLPIVWEEHHFGSRIACPRWKKLRVQLCTVGRQLHNVACCGRLGGIIDAPVDSWSSPR